MAPHLSSHRRDDRPSPRALPAGDAHPSGADLVRVLHGAPRPDELGAVLAVLLAACQPSQPDGPTDPGHDGPWRVVVHPPPWSVP